MKYEDKSQIIHMNALKWTQDNASRCIYSHINADIPVHV